MKMATFGPVAPSAVIAAISSNVQPRMGVRHGFRIPEGARAFKVTDAEGKVLKKLDAPRPKSTARS